MTNQFTDEQVKSALDAFVGGDFFTEYPQSVAHWEPRIRAALEAAAGVAPQAPDASIEQALGFLDHLNAQNHIDWTSYSRLHDLISATAPVQPSSKVQDSPEIENRGAEISTPVQPSSTVDEARAWDEGYWQGINGHTGPGNPYRTDESTTPRAVVEAIGGEGRG